MILFTIDDREIFNIINNIIISVPEKLVEKYFYTNIVIRGTCAETRVINKWQRSIIFYPPLTQLSREMHNNWLRAIFYFLLAREITSNLTS